MTKTKTQELIIDADFFEHLLNCLANQKFIGELPPNGDALAIGSIEHQQVQEDNQKVIDEAWKKGMDILSARHEPNNEVNRLRGEGRTHREHMGSLPKDRRERIEKRGNELIIEQLIQENAKLKEELKHQKIINELNGDSIERGRAENEEVWREKLELQAELDALKQQSQWIDVNERLPEDYQHGFSEDVLLAVASIVTTPTHFIYAGFYNYNSSNWERVDGGISEPTHWQPLPPPPNNDKGEGE